MHHFFLIRPDLTQSDHIVFFGEGVLSDHERIRRGISILQESLMLVMGVVSQFFGLLLVFEAIYEPCYLLKNHFPDGSQVNSRRYQFGFLELTCPLVALADPENIFRPS